MNRFEKFDRASSKEAVGLYAAFKEAESYLAGCGIADASVDAWLLLEHVTGISRAMFLADPRRELAGEDRKKYWALLQKRGNHIPLQHLTGVQEFMGFPFLVNENVLIPRQDTETLVEEALKHVKPGMQVLDLCTGSGCIAVSLAKLGGLHVEAADISFDALAVAQENAKRLNADAAFIQSDLFAQITGRYDMIVSNPPYIRTSVIGGLSEEVRLHEPYQALDGKEDGLYFYRKIVSEGRARLNEGGHLLFEIGYDQREAVEQLLKEAGYREIRAVKDLAGLDRVVMCRK